MRGTKAAIVVLLALCVPLVVRGQADIQDPNLRKASTLIAKGHRALVSGNSRAAEARYNKARQIIPELPEAHLGLGHVNMQQRQFEAAHAAYLEAERCYRTKGVSLLQLQSLRYSRAQTMVSDLLRRAAIMQENADRIEGLMGPESTGDSARRQRELLRMFQSDARSLRAEAERLQQIDPPPPPADGVPGEVFFFLGNARINLGRLEDAVQAWETCVERMPDFSLVHNNLAVAYWKLDRLQLATHHLEAAEQLGFEVNPRFKADLEASVSARHPNP